jgi:flavin-dependent thymidylate synthase
MNKPSYLEMQNSVELSGLFGSDLRHALAAWTSTERTLSDEKRARIPGLLKFLAENGHTTPFEKSYIEFLVTCDTASHIHILKHRIGVSVNGESARYKELKGDKYYIPKDWPAVDQLFLRQHILAGLADYHDTLEKFKDTEITRKRAKESTRFYLSYANQVQLNVSFNFQSFMHFQKLRNADDAQLEIREIAKEMLRLVKEHDGEPFKYSLEAYGY